MAFSSLDVPATAALETDNAHSELDADDDAVEDSRWQGA